MPQKTETQNFVQGWDKTVAWARSNNIPASAYYPVYQMDMQRMLTGYAMSEPDRIAAIQAAVGLQARTPTPATPDWNIPKNLGSNAWQIFTGLMPWSAGGGLLGNIFDTIKNTITHPSIGTALVAGGTVLGGVFGGAPGAAIGAELGGLGATALNAGDIEHKNHEDFWNAMLTALQQETLSPNSIYSWIPGFYDAAQISRGKAGLHTLAQNPLTALLDVAPSDMAGSFLAHTEVGMRAAVRMGITKEDLSNLGAARLGYKMAKTIPLGSSKLRLGETAMGPVLDASGDIIGVKPLNLGERINLWRNIRGLGSDQAELIKGMIFKSDKGTYLLNEKLGPLMKSIESLKSEQDKKDFGSAMRDDTRPFQEKIDDPSYSNNVKEVIQAIHDYIQQDRELKLAAGGLLPITVTVLDEDGNEVTREEVYGLKGNGPLVQNAKTASEVAQSLLDHASQRFDAIVRKVLFMDRAAEGYFANIEGQYTNVYQSIKQTLPALNDPRLTKALSATLPAPPVGPTSAIRSYYQWMLSTKNSPLLHNLLSRDPARRLVKNDVNAMRRLFAPGGLIDLMMKAYKDQDWESMTDYSGKIKRTFDTQVFKDIPPTSPLAQIKQTITIIDRYARSRKKLQNAADKLFYGRKQPFGIKEPLIAGKNSIYNLTKKANEAHQHFIETAINHPPEYWSNIKNDKMIEQIMASEEASQTVTEEATKYFAEHGFRQSNLDKIRQDPRTLVQLFIRAAEDAYGSGQMPDIDLGLWKSMNRDAYREISALRAMGHDPEYIPMISPFDVERQMREGMSVHIGTINPRPVSSTFGRVFDFNSSVFNVAAGLMKDAKEQIQQDIIREYFNEYFQKYLIPSKDMNNEMLAYLQDEIAHHALKNIERTYEEEGVDAIVRRQIKNSGYITYDPNSIFGEGFSVPRLDGEYYVNVHLADAVRQGVERFQLPSQQIYDRATRVFRFSILGLSPRYTAHILVGGTALLAYRGHPGMLTPRVLGASVHALLHGELPEDELARYPNAVEAFTLSATNEGMADQVFHAAAGYTAGNKVINEWLDNHGMTRDVINWGKAAANINFRFTRAVVRMQRSMVYLDGARRAEKRGYFDELVSTPRLDKDGKPIVSERTGHPIFDRKMERREMTADRAHHEGMMAMHDVMGELRHMTPLERNVFVRIFPFYGWTKHVLNYVFTYPTDHPYRTVFLSQLASQNSADMASGLPLRLQLLMFLGQPDPMGNVTAIEGRYMDPLRDTANYASLSGWIASVNPIFTSIPAYFDPQIVFGGNELYPTLSYNQIYGVKQAGPQGNAWTVAEQFVPELQGLDAALNLSGQYGYLKEQGGNNYIKKVMQSLNVDMFLPQTINVRQIAAQNELDRFQAAKAATLQAAQTGDMSSLSGYAPNAQLPDPLNDYYTITPAYLAAMNKMAMEKFGLPYYAIASPPPNPPIR